MLVSNVFDKRRSTSSSSLNVSKDSLIFSGNQKQDGNHIGPPYAVSFVFPSILFSPPATIFSMTLGGFFDLSGGKDSPFFGMGSSTWNIICRNCSQQILMFIKRFGLSTRGIFLGLRRHRLYAKKRKLLFSLFFLVSYIIVVCYKQTNTEQYQYLS